MKGSPWPVVLALGLLVGAAAAVAQEPTYRYLGYSVLGSSQDPFPYYLDGRYARPAGISLPEVEAAMKAAAKTWEDVDCAWPAFTYKGDSSTTPIADVTNTTDRFNVMPVWIFSASDPRYASVLNNGAEASAAAPLTYAGYVYQCDIFLNAVNYKWSTLTTPPADSLDLQTRLTHELGACLGLDDTYDLTIPNAVMYFQVTAGEARRQLSAYDRTALCRAYPQNGAVGSPCETTCTNGLTCVSTPSTTSPAVTLKVCAKGCTGVTTGECPAPYVCRASTAVPGSNFACLPALPDAVTRVGQPCDGANGCGGARSRCIAGGAQQPSGFEKWKGGYCTESCQSTAECPAGSECLDVDSVGRVCVQRCRPGSGDCRDGYACAPEGTTNVCIPACYGDADCGGGGTLACRVCDRVCVTRQTAGRAVGDPCTADSQCGTSQYCLFLNGNPQGVCTQPCAQEACGCPAGTTCRVAGSTGARACLKNCTQGTCDAQLQCGPVENGSACLPRCRGSLDCAPGLACGDDGTCYDPSTTRPDAGTCASCNDAGTQPPPVDGGSGGGGGSHGPSGCGCQGSPTSAASGLVALLALVWMAGRRNPWRRP